MSSSASPAPRRSQRNRKTVKPFASGSTSPNKRKRTVEDDDNLDENEVSDPAEHESGADEPDATDEEVEADAEEFRAPKSKPKTQAATRKGKGKASAPPPPKKARTTKANAPKLPKPTKQRGRKTKPANGEFDATKLTTDTKIEADNPLFNAILNPSAALQSTVEDFLESLSQSPGAAQAELLNCILRACGCNDSVDADEVLDYDGVVDSLDNFTEGLKQENSPIYPLTSKLPVFKKFRNSLSELIERLILSAAEVGSLYTSDLVTTMQTWVVAMSSSQIRSFRHTATVVALEVETALCQVAAAVEKEAEVIGRQKEGERKRKATNKASGAREKDLEGKAAEVRGRRTALAEFLKEIVDGVFVHRYRDLDPNIRAECVRAMGFWFKNYPAHFLDASYLRYVGWVLSDSNTHVRLEAVKALAIVYDQGDYVGSLTHFTERFKPRLVEMATGDTELGVRIAVIGVLGAIDGHSLLEDEREKLCLLVYDEEARVRKAVSGFVSGVWEELVEERLVGRKPTQKMKERAGIKALGMLLVRWGKILDKAAEIGEDESVLSGQGGPSRTIQASVLLATDQRGRTALAVEALWDSIEAVNDWESMLDVLLLDHSASDDDDLEGADSIAASAKNIMDEAWRLQEVEESILLEVFVASLQRAKSTSASGKKGEDEQVASDITRALIKGLPRLFIKYQTDGGRISDVLLIPPLMNLDLYLEMRMINAYSNLWDDVTKQFLSHSSSNVLTKAVASIRHFMDATSLSNTNSTKILELEDELATQLRDAVAGREEIEIASFSEDEVLSLSAICTRVCVLIGSRDMTTWIEDSEGGKQSSAWDIISALVERGRLGYKEEERMMEQGLHLLGLHVIWKTRGLPNVLDPSPDEVKYKETLREQRDSLMEKLIEYAVGTQSNTAEGVKRAAFQNLMNLHILFRPTQVTSPDGHPLPTASLSLELVDEVQYRCAGFIQAAIEQYSELLDPGVSSRADNGDDTAHSDFSSDDDDGPVEKTAGQNKNAKRMSSREPLLPRSLLEQEYIFMGVVSAFLRAIRAGVVHVHHSAVLLAHYGRLGPAFDLCTKVIIEVLREEGIYNENGDTVVAVVTQALRESFTLVLDAVVRDEESTVALAKQLSSTLMIRGAQLAVLKRLDSQYVIKIHTELLTWIIKRIGVYEHNKNKKARNNAVLFFRALTFLLPAVETRDALKIKAHMDQSFAQAKVEIPPTSKLWEPQRGYEKKLNTIMSKDKGAGAKGRKAKGITSAVVVTSDEEESEPEMVPKESEGPSRPRPKPRPIRRPSPPESALSEPESIVNPLEQEAAVEDNIVVTPKSRVGPRRTFDSQSPTKTPTVASITEANGFVTPKSTRKRRRTPVEDEIHESPDPDSPQDKEASVNRSPSREPTPSGDIVIRRKRARH
ncbi:hypothetical protein BJ138DRAFT_1076400 [Hygrophoropsis aurantiaca]|uniref:Uncharacterized protein n=1 Tax=Hygrophoropsis aurantiaca TaxID=72124 RepID=A0ACB8ASL6_9AGAM|nr:hypothetical protein BJ138DRAFT_1076400 [Hygrophoropsis aurantiaca]